MRGLKTSDIFNFSKLVKKMELKEDMRKVLSEIQEGNATRVGLDLIMLVLENLSNAEREFYLFISAIVDKTPEEVGELPLEEIIEICTTIFKDPNFASFFKFAAK